jgi:hypothetical protein
MEVGSIGLIIPGGFDGSDDVGSIGLATTPMSLGAIRLGIKSKLGWNCRRVRIAKLLRPGRT